jgi:hypothetical protein
MGIGKPCLSPASSGLPRLGENPAEKTNPGLGDDPLAGVGRMKPHVGGWQTALVKTAEHVSASNMPNTIPVLPQQIKQFCPSHLSPGGAICSKRTKPFM